MWRHTTTLKPLSHKWFRKFFTEVAQDSYDRHQIFFREAWTPEASETLGLLVHHFSLYTLLEQPKHCGCTKLSQTELFIFLSHYFCQLGYAKISENFFDCAFSWDIVYLTSWYAPKQNQKLGADLAVCYTLCSTLLFISRWNVATHQVDEC